MRTGPDRDWLADNIGRDEQRQTLTENSDSQVTDEQASGNQIEVDAEAVSDQAEGSASPPAGNASGGLGSFDGFEVGLQEEVAPHDVVNDATVSIRQDILQNQGTVVGVLHQTVRRMMDSHDLPPDYVQRVVSLFAAPVHIGDAVGKLRDHRVVVLVGEPESGRHSAAVWLLNNQGGLELREVRRDPGDGFVPENLVSRRPTGWILDLRGRTDDISGNFGRTLATSSESLETARSYLVVVIRRDLWRQTGAGGEHLKVELGLPGAVAVVERRLQYGHPPLPLHDVQKWTQFPEIRNRITDLGPPDAVEWAEAIRYEHLAPATFDGDVTEDDIFRSKVKNVIDSQNNWRSELLRWHRQNRDSRQRNFLLTAALLEGSSAPSIFIGAEQLAFALGEGETSSPGQTGPGLLELLDDVQADLTKSETISYRRIGFADAVLDYFWLDRIHLRDRFMDWATRLPVDQQGLAAQNTAERVGQYLLRWGINQDDLTLIEGTISIWSRHNHIYNAAVALMTAAALDTSLGSKMRIKMLSWAKSESAEDLPVKSVVANVCGGPIGLIYPKLMLYRLGYLAKTADSQLRGEVGAATASLWAHVELRERIRVGITKWLDSSNDLERAAGRRMFLALACLSDSQSGLPSLLSQAGQNVVDALPRDRAFLVRGWRALLNQRHVEAEVGEAFTLFLETALSYPQCQAFLLNVFVEALHDPVDGRFHATRRVALDNLAFRWQPSSPDNRFSHRHALRDDLIMLASSFDPLLPSPSSPDLQAGQWDG
ncbi:hypothetical protein I0C86_03995 [Plantactinospora sp. S1510]|uniref:Uncharacterized protein n=1 Tax=Plantactinospora alkalitolerans TaxID=2789879 RepID=A0ABS0GPP3_9ACTN|nr:hypothetical protein [Plantactinospora alkalitolerans]MBF9128158.1 hypothetical protein [Plantactinospora alkalitolerans]